MSDNADTSTTVTDPTASSAIDLTLHQPEIISRIRVGCGLTEHVADLLTETFEEKTAKRTLCVVCDQAVSSTHARRVADGLAPRFSTVHMARLPADESHKTLTSVEWLYSQFIRAHLDRLSVIISVGGGVIGDVAGFAAATFLRGLPFVNIPTTLLSMVDASVGGKTGVNCIVPLENGASSDNPDETSELTGRMFLAKNLVGAFHQPSLVLIDPTVLETLPDREYHSGLAECIKHAMVADMSLFEWMEQNVEGLLGRNMSLLPRFIEQNVRIKADIVQRDERETGERMRLNLGHTFAHAIETRSQLGLTHGEAVAVGLIASTSAAIHLNSCSSEHLYRVESLVSNLNLPAKVQNLPSDNDLIAAMRRDKKVINDRIRLVVPVGIGSTKVVEADEAAFKAGWRAVRA